MSHAHFPPWSKFEASMKNGNSVSLKFQQYLLDKVDGGLRRNLQHILTKKRTLLQVRAHEEWKSWSKSLDKEQLLQVDDVHPVFIIFDKFFFAGCLCEHTDLIWESAKETDTFEGYCEIQGRRAKIVLREYPLQMGDRSGIQYLLSTLLHEMCHAFILLFACKCGTCYEKHLSLVGLSGHGSTWSIAATAIQVEADRSFRIAKDSYDLGVGVAQAEEHEKRVKLMRCHWKR